MSEDTRCNGWTNYATWRINLEIFDGYDPEGEPVDGDWCKEYAEKIIFYSSDVTLIRPSLLEDYAFAFINNVNWREIAKSINEIREIQEEEDDQ